MFLNVAVETCNPLGGRLNKKPNDYRYVIIFHVEHENYYLYYFVFGFQHFSFALQIIKCIFKSGTFSKAFAS